MPNSRSTRVLWLLEEIGAPYDLTLLSREDRKTDEHLARHPLGRVPALEDDEGFLFESLALCLHVADLYPDAGMIPPVGTHDRALVYQWISFAMTELEPAILEVFGARRAEDEERASEALETFRAAAEVVERALDGREFLVGDRFSVADLTCAAVLIFARRAELTEGLPNVAGYLERIENRPARQRATAIGVD